MSAPVLLVTGARLSLGRALVEHFLRAGWTVVGCSRRASDLTHPAYRHLLADVGHEADVVRVLAVVREEYGRLDAVINNAAVATMNHTLLVPAADALRVLQTNVLGPFLVMREAARVMRRRRYGRIVNVTSTAVPLRLQGEALYGASKAALEHLTRVCAQEFAPWGITVNAVGPGPMRLGLVRGVSATRLQRVLERQARPVFTEVEEVCMVVEGFVGDVPGAVTGQTIYLGGVA